MINQENIEELRDEFISTGGIVTSLPEVQEVRDQTTVFIKDIDGSGVKTYKVYQMIDNEWYLISTATKA